jgi:hypothetical protein
VHQLRLSAKYLVKRLGDEAWPGPVVPADFFGATPDRTPGGLRSVLIIEYRYRQAIAGLGIQEMVRGTHTRDGRGSFDDPVTVIGWHRLPYSDSSDHGLSPA